MDASSHVLPAVSQRLDTFLDTQRSATAEMGTEAAILIDAAAASLRGGKRLRAAFCYWGWRAVVDTRVDAAPAPSPDDERDIISVAAALEIFQSAALVHDDIIDNSDTRRGLPASHRALEAGHGANGWAGDGAAFGRSAALLLGDLLVAWSDDLFEEGIAGITDAAARRKSRHEYAAMRRDVTLGQFLDIAEESAFAVSPGAEHLDRALRVATYKSARYSVQQPLTIGAALAGAAETQSAALAEFGYPIGMAFQLRDDVLGVFGDERLTGKPAGDDLREGKRTALIAITRERLGDARELLDELLGSPDLDATQIALLQSMIVDTGALDGVESMITDYVARADAALADAPLGDTALTVLRALAVAVSQRST